jgi:hypothetical protein
MLLDALAGACGWWPPKWQNCAANSKLTTGLARGDRVATGIDDAAQEANQASPAPLRAC